VGVSDCTEKRTAPQWQEPLSNMRLIYREPWEGNVSLVTLIEYADAPAEVRAVYDDIMRTRGVDWINNFWKVLANDPAELARVWRLVKEVMAPGALDPLVKEMIYLAVSVTNGCDYCTYSHTAGARKKGMTDAMLMELMAVVGLANQTNRLADGLRPEVDPQFR
jgi:AhpD family alkylhydroperoxidase